MLIPSFARRRVLMLLSSLLVGSCSSSHLAPDATGLVLPAGVYEFSVRGFGLSEDPRYPACSPLLVPAAGTAVTSYLSVAKEGDTWVGRSIAPAVDSIELRFRDTGTQGFGRVVSGTIRGTVTDAGTTTVRARDVTVTFGAGGADAAAFEGGTDTPISTFVSGRISGAIRFADSTGAASTCPAILWNLQPR
jgi:hypothetical protein